MPLRPVPWAIGNGAENSVELARAGITSATSGATGIAEPGDFIVKALPTPGAAVRVHKGGGVIKSTYPGVFGQSYAVQEQSYTDVPVAATGSSAGATKYVYVLIKDPQYGGQNPPSVENGPYNDYAVTTTLPVDQPYLLLAKINQPKSTATIAQAMIEDLRKVANPLWEPIHRSRPSLSTDTGMKLSSTTGEWFPGDGAETGARQIVDVPDFAVKMILKPSWLSVRYDAGKNAFGQFWLSYGPNDNPLKYSTQEFQFDSAGAAANAYRTNWLGSAYVTVPKECRGAQITFAFRARRDPASANNAASMDGLSGLDLSGFFLQVADPSTE
ncbi:MULTISPECIES: hypothetical protein [unclassified Brevibacterium]|uniref:hypothetical protein n=1 Tax=unclassified Brevibacterium TaxID=2614124 RepID=UPI001E657B18|nr:MULTISPECIES: hypothetical protein [unclassified Brevibacterium]MCD1287348.1 hypothetical protein [Brevibacterium sp. CCUG 69071]MDK8436397.1 hypothetical protein [Brevibacterium sp. H-BE7]